MKKDHNILLGKNIDFKRRINSKSVIEDITKQLKKYELLQSFSSKREREKYIKKLNNIEKQNLLNLNIDRSQIKFDTTLLINKELLNTNDYNKRVEALVSIKNAEGWYHLFDRMLRPEFLNSPNFYKDIETLKRAKSAQTPLWVIGEPSFINSPYHDEDFELLTTSKDTSTRNCDHLVWEAIATIAKNVDSIKSEYHREDLKTIVKYSDKSLQGPYTYPKGSINNLAINPVSLNDTYHLENMEILAQNTEIGNFLYAVMTDPSAITRRDYRTIIKEMVESKENKRYVFLLCLYAVGEEKAIQAQNILEEDYYHEIKKQNDISKLLEKVKERIDILDDTTTDTKEVESAKVNQEQKQEQKILMKIRNRKKNNS